MVKQTPLINKPETADMIELPYGVQKVEWFPDARFPFCGLFVVQLEDHTFGSLIRSKLSKDERVLFVGYRIPHPLENRLEIRLRTKNDSPLTVALNAIASLRSGVGQLRKGYLASLQSLGVRIGE